MPSSSHYDSIDLKAPKSRPIDSLEKVDEWLPSAADIFNIATVPYRRDQSGRDLGKSKLLLCHDMAGGYREDEMVQGNDYETIWSCQTWHLVDIFVYFSHHRITIPPVNFTNACHRNNVLSLGTFIVEWQEGISELEKFLFGPSIDVNFDKEKPSDIPSDDMWNPHYADKLVEIAEQYKFDGWLINIESPFAASSLPAEYKAQQMVNLLKYLTEKLHQRVPHSKIIWYDSMTKKGDIKWQNTLNDMNSEFFNATDGIFTNYFWKADTPVSAFEKATAMGRKSNEVYMGSDVWGRGSFASGFETWRGVQEASKFNLSSAIFGPAWTYEFLGAENFSINDSLLWYGGMPSQYPLLGQNEIVSLEAGPTTAEIQDNRRYGISDIVTPRPASTTATFFTCFDRGYGNTFNIAGERQMLKQWSHLSHQSIQPNIKKPSGIIQYEVSIDHAYLGGSSLGIYINEAFGHDTTTWSTEMIPLYSLNMPLGKVCRVQYTVKDIKQNISFGIYVRVARPENATQRHILNSSQEATSDTYMIIESDVLQSNTESQEIVNPSICATETQNKWLSKTRTFKFSGDDDADWKLIEVGVVLHKPRAQRVATGLVAFLGSLSIDTQGTTLPTFEFPHINIWDRSFHEVDLPSQKVISASGTNKYRTLFCTLEWNIKFVDAPLTPNKFSSKIWDHVYFFAIYARPVRDKVDHPKFKPFRWAFLGTAFTCAFRVSGIMVQEKGSAWEFEVRAISHSGKEVAKPANIEINV
ncbi:glycosyl hydrolase family 85-domain-containing protein [Umbelopsis sp. AD052]|nr:glycosyl hydrolase family 85-domain-containing protein [Umbelopsis sp. AD052]